MTKVLENIRVIDITRYVAGPICTAQLADLGAEVIHVENVGGAEDRSPLPVDPDYPGGAGFIQVNRNKKGLELDLTCDSGQAILHKLVASSDILVANIPNRAAIALGIDYDSLRKIRPDIIFVHITTFGNEGPYANRTGFDAIAQVMSGATYLSGWPDQPMKSGAAWVDMTAGNHAAMGALAALLHRNSTGKGQKVEVNLLHSALSITNYFLMEEALTGIGRVGIGNRAPSGGPADLIKTLDGAVYIATLGNPMFARFARMIGKPQIIDDPRFSKDELRAEHGVLLSEMATSWAEDKTTAQALELLAEHRIPAGPMLKPEEVLRDEHVLSAGFLQDVDVPGLKSPVPFITPPYRLSESPATIEAGPPMAGEHTDSILQGLGYTSEQIQELRANSVI
jgi:crotonobetainyl-CoA:carnitine CoA-transferase CaiB-like acyl-CoA transferase